MKHIADARRREGKADTEGEEETDSDQHFLLVESWLLVWPGLGKAYITAPHSRHQAAPVLLMSENLDRYFTKSWPETRAGDPDSERGGV